MFFRFLMSQLSVGTTVAIVFLFFKIHAFIISLDFFKSTAEIDSGDKDDSGDYDYTNYDYDPDFDISHARKAKIEKRRGANTELRMKDDSLRNQTYFDKNAPKGNLRGSRTYVHPSILPTSSPPSYSASSSSSTPLHSFLSTSTSSPFLPSVSGIATFLSSLFSSLLHSSLLSRRSASLNPLPLSYSIPLSSISSTTAAASTGPTNISVWGNLWGDHLQTIIGATCVRTCYNNHH